MAQNILPERLLNSWDSSARTHRSLTIFYLVALGFVWIVVEGTTHEQLLNPEIKIALPVVGSSIPVLSFYIAAPIFLLLLHTQLLLQVVHLSNSFTNFAELSPFKVNMEGSKRKEDWRNLVLPTLLTSVLLQPPDLNRYAYFLMRIIAFIFYWCLVPFILIRIQLKFLPYHGEYITLLHQVSISISLLLITFFPLVIKGLKDQKKIFFKYFTKPQNFLLPIAIYPLVLILSWTVLVIPKTNEECINKIFKILAKIIIKNSSNKKDCYKIGDYVERNIYLPGKQLALNPPPEIIASLKDKDDKIKQLDFYGILNLTNRDLRFASFQDADLTKADFRGSILDYAYFYNAKLTSTIWRPYFNLDNSIKITSAKGADFSSSYLFRADMKQANLQDATIFDAFLAYADLSYANLKGADLRNIQMHEANLSYANLKGADIRNAYAQDVNLKYANLQSANLSLSDFSRAKLNNANLKGAVMHSTYFLGAKFLDANLQGADLEHASLKATTIVDANLTGANLSNANLKGAIIYESNLSGTDMKNAQIDYAEFTNSVFGKFDFTQNQLLEWLKKIPETVRSGGTFRYPRRKFHIKMLNRNHKETTLPILNTKTTKVCHSGQKPFKNAGIKSLPVKTCGIERKRLYGNFYKKNRKG